MAIDLEKAGSRFAALKAEMLAMSENSRGARAPVELDQQSVRRLWRIHALQQQALAPSQERARQRDLVPIRDGPPSAARAAEAGAS